MKQPDNPYKIAFLLSGSGSTLENLLDHIASNKVQAQVAVVISSREGVFGLERAKKWRIPYEVIPYIKYKKNKIEEYSQKITRVIDSYQVDLIVLGGFMSRYILPDKYKDKAINIHPALIPSFCGKGFYGEKVHQAVINYGAKITGCTVHFIDNEYDNGPIIAQESIAVLEDDTPQTLQERVVNLEQKVYPKVIQTIVENRVRVSGRKVSIIPAK